MALKRILWLPGWYPSSVKPYNGDFIKRHAEAVSLYEQVTVIYVIRDMEGGVTKSVCSEIRNQGNLSEIVIYYYVPPKRIKVFERLSSYRKYRKVYKEAIRNYIREKGNPGLLHVHMGMQVASVANWLTRIAAIPVVVTEHWSGFLSEAGEKFSELPFYIKRPWKSLIRKAAGVSVVSAYLAKAVADLFYLKNILVIPNVVNENVFKCTNAVPEKSAAFLHVSGLDELKNPRVILDAFHLVLKKYPEATLTMIGSEKKEIADTTRLRGIGESVKFLPEIPQEQLAIFMQQSDALILYSKFETFGCVIIEANACGTPVIVSDIPVFHERVTEGENGIFAGVENVQKLAEKMEWLIGAKNQYNKTAVANKTIEKYGYKAVGKLFSDWYKRVLSSQP